MELKIKESFLDAMIFCALTNKWTELILTDPDNWLFYYNNGYNYVFEINEN